MVQKKLKKGDQIGSFIDSLESYFPSVEQFNFIVFTPSVGAARRFDKKISSKDIVFGEKKWEFERKLIYRFDRANFETEQLGKLIAHDLSESQRIISIKKGKIKEWIAETTQSISEKEVIGLVSKCSTEENEEMHIPLMDFSCPPTPNYEKFVSAVLKEVGCERGILANSGKSFHFYGLELLTKEQWQKFMFYFLLLSPFADIRYIAHRLLSGYGILRIGSNWSKPKVPEIIRVFQ